MGKDTQDMIKEAHNAAAMGRLGVLEWHKLFREEVLTRLRIRIVRVYLAIANNWQLHHDNAPSYTAFRVVEYLTQHNVATLPHPRLGPTRPYLFSRIKLAFKGKHHGLAKAVQQAVSNELNSIPV
ncbi:uncharacterized protein TNCV_4757431 [Trichonephila clavipes]|nr:uncharacterized protein TNCV_4757431 [Trichonephila clavipes]